MLHAVLHVLEDLALSLSTESLALFKPHRT